MTPGSRLIMPGAVSGSSVVLSHLLQFSLIALAVVRLQAAFEGQQRFIANASHELRTPLAVMRATVDVVLDNQESTPGDLRGMAADIRAAVDQAEHLIGALLILARNERGLTVREETDLRSGTTSRRATSGSAPAR
jgi:signal transduction histidine kinase